MYLVKNLSKTTHLSNFDINQYVSNYRNVLRQNKKLKSSVWKFYLIKDLNSATFLKLSCFLDQNSSCDYTRFISYYSNIQCLHYYDDDCDDNDDDGDDDDDDDDDGNEN